MKQDKGNSGEQCVRAAYHLCEVIPRKDIGIMGIKGKTFYPRAKQTSTKTFHIFISLHMHNNQKPFSSQEMQTFRVKMEPKTGLAQVI